MIDLEIPEHESVLVLNGILSTDSTIRVSLSNSVGAFENNQINSINNAIVLIYENNTFLDTMYIVVPDTLWVDGQGFNNNIFYYELDYYPKSGFDYRIEVQHENYNNIYASTTIPNNINIFNISILDNSLDTNFLEATLNFSFNDDPNKRDYYRISLEATSSYYYDASTYYRFFFILYIILLRIQKTRKNGVRTQTNLNILVKKQEREIKKIIWVEKK